MVKKKSVRKSLKSLASFLGLSAGVVGWSALATAESDDSQVQTLLLPEHYHLSDDGLVTFKLQTGEQLTLNPDQYLILQDGLLLITDEIAQASIESLPVMGSIRAQVTSELQPVRSPDGSVVLASDASPLWSGDGPAPRLFEEVDIQRFELAQNNSETQTQSETNLGQAAGAAAGGLSVIGVGLAGGIFGTRPEQSTEEAPVPSPPSITSPAPPTVTGAVISGAESDGVTPKADTLVAGDKILVTVTVDENITVDTSGGTPQYTIDVGGVSKTAGYVSGSGGTSLVFAYEVQAGDFDDAGGITSDTSALDANNGTLKDADGHDLDLTTIAVSAGANSVSVDAPEPEFLSNAMFRDLEPRRAPVFTGSAGDSFIGYSAADPNAQDTLTGVARGVGEFATFDMTAGGDNLLLVGDYAASSSSAMGASGSLNYFGGSGKDDLTFGDVLAFHFGVVVINAGDGDNSLNAGDRAAYRSGYISYTGGDMADSLTFGILAGEFEGTLSLNAGNGDNILTAGDSFGSGKASVSYTGGSGKDELTFGHRLGFNDGTVSLNLGNGDNVLTAGDQAGSASPLGSLSYTGGSGKDDLTFGNSLGAGGGDVSLNAGDGDNTLNAGAVAASTFATLSYTGGTGSDVLTFGHGLGLFQGTVILNLGNGDNILTAGDSAVAYNGGSLSYSGGSGSDFLTFGDRLGDTQGTVVINAGDGYNTLNAGSSAGDWGATLSYTGGTGSDVLTFGGGLGRVGASMQIDLGNDSSSDAIKFEGTVALSAADESEYVQIVNYDVIMDAMTVTGGSVSVGDFRTDGNDIHWERPADINITFIGLGPNAENIAISSITGTINVV